MLNPSPKQLMEKKIRKAEREYKEQRGNEYCLFKTEYGVYQIAQHPLWYLENESLDSIVFCEIVMELKTRSFFEAEEKAYEAGYRGVINSDIEKWRSSGEEK